MKAVIFIFSLFLTSLLFSQGPGKHRVLLKGEEASLILIGKDTLTTGKNKVQILAKIPNHYWLSLAGGSILKKDGFWLLCPSRGVQFCTVSIHKTVNKKNITLYSARCKVKLSPQEIRRRELGME